MDRKQKNIDELNSSINMMRKSFVFSQAQSKVPSKEGPRQARLIEVRRSLETTKRAIRG